MNATRQRGVAVVTAILVVALVASVAAYLARQNHVFIRHMENRQALAQAEALALAAIDWTRAILAEDARNNSVDYLNEPWASTIAPIETDGGELWGRLIDQQGLFNLNNLARGGRASETDMAHFRRLLAALGLPAQLADAAADWIDADGAVRLPGGAEDVDYLALNPPYRAANRPFIDVAELIRVKGYDAATVERLRPFVTALPVPTAVNLNTAPTVVLAAVLGNGAADAATVMAARGARPFADRRDFAARLPEVAQRAAVDAVGFGSRYFLAEVRVRVRRVQTRRAALLQREGQGWPSVLWRRQW